MGVERAVEAVDLWSPPCAVTTTTTTAAAAKPPQPRAKSLGWPALYDHSPKCCMPNYVVMQVKQAQVFVSGKSTGISHMCKSM